MDLADKNLFDSKSALPNDNDRWQYIIDLLASHFSIALIEIDGTKLINLNSQAQKILNISYLKDNLKLSDLFVDFPPLFSLRKKSRIILHTRSENKPVLLLLIKILPGRKKIFEIRDHSLPPSISRPTNETVKENSAFIALLLKSGPMVYYSYTPDKRDLVWYSDQIEFMTGYRLEDFKDNSGLWLSRIYADDLPLVKGKFDNYVPNQHVSCEYRWKDRNNKIIWILDQAIMVETPDRKWLVVGNFMDITDRKEAEFAVIENERNYREIFNSSNEAIFIHDPKTGKILDVNDTMLRMFKITYEKALSKGINHISLNEPPYDEGHAQKYIEKTFTSGEAQQFNWISRRDDQTPFWSEVTLKAITIGSEKKIMASVKNIDQKKRAEDQIKYQNDFEKLILDISTRFINIPYDEVDSSIEQSIKQICNFAKTDAGYLFLFDEAEQTSNLKYLWQRKIMNFNRDQLSRIKVEISDWYTKKIKSGEIVMFEDLNDFPQGEEELKSIISSQGVKSFVDIPLIYQNLVIGTLGIAVAKPARKWLSYEISLLRLTGQIFVNAMKRKESFLKLLDSEEKYRHIIENQSDLIIKLSPEGHLIFVSPSYCEVFGLTEDELLGKKYSSTIHKDDQLTMNHMMESLLSFPHSCYIEQRVLTKKGWRWIAWNNKAVLNEDLKVTEILGVGRDITYQKGVEEALLRSEDRFRSIVRHSSDIIFIVDKEGYILYDTPTVKKILGYEEGSLVGTKASELIHADDLDFVLNHIRTAIIIERSANPIEFRLKHADNRPVFMEGYGINLINHPSIQGIVVTLRDISERKQIEKKILDTVIRTEEQERERFAKNLHDDLGPLLSSIKMYVNSLDVSNSNEKQEFIITQLNEVVREAIQTTKDVSNDLSPHILLNYGLVSAIENFFRKVPLTIKINFNSSLPSERYSATMENSFYRIIKELINNTLKHAGASKIDVFLEEIGDHLNLVYSDNGKGFELKSNNLISGSGMGLSNIISRAKSLNGIYEFQTSMGKGFTFKISIPMHPLLD